ncbi:tetratricopeptide repeat protein [Rhodoferax sp.]|uniref:tetratricopeptide repeat protein n=1 Tax=Rhodoferax sp. TaxID=50421 RepID=UPI00277A418B|nr:hypothetical protein [Rhodoferax sp.]
MIRKDMLRRAAAVGALLASTLAQQAAAQSGAAQAKAASPASAASAPAAEDAGPTVRPEIRVLLVDAQRMLGDKQYKEAAAKLVAAEAIADKTPYELHILARLKSAHANATGDADAAAQQYELASQGPWMKDADKINNVHALVSLYYNAKNYTKAIEWIDRYNQAGGTEPMMGNLRAQAFYLKGDYANAARALELEAGKATAAGQTPTEVQLKLLADARRRIKDETGSTQTVELLVRHYPSKANWATLVQRLWAKPALAIRLHSDVFRLQQATGGLGESSDFTEFAEIALQAGSAGEALKVMEQGYAAGVLGTGDKPGEQQRLKDKLTRMVTEDRNTLEKDLVSARKAADGTAMFNYGFNMVHLGLAERGVTQMEQALAKGIARHGDSAKLRLVAVYAQLGQRDKAKQLLSTLSGKADPIGLDDTVRYWALWLNQSSAN